MVGGDMVTGVDVVQELEIKLRNLINEKYRNIK
jgi:hypothetical protein